ncbi:MAG: hypothetical protein M3492_05235 [Actinomycetota bacterium]|nr:hypothetical protein [Actinomycetota bacterium]
MIWFLTTGLLIGGLARVVRPGRRHLSLTATLLLGSGGAVLGAAIANSLFTADYLELNPLSSIGAVVGAVTLMRFAQRRHRRPRTVLDETAERRQRTTS